MTAPAIRYARTDDNSTVSYLAFEGDPPADVIVRPCGGIPLPLWLRLPSLLDFVNDSRRGRGSFVVELRGSGLSGPLLEGPPVPQWERDVEAVMRLAGGPVHLYGHGGSCHAAAAIARRMPDQLLSLTLSDPLPRSLMPLTGWTPFFENNFRSAMVWAIQAYCAPGRSEPVTELAAEWERLYSRSMFQRLVEMNETVSLEESLAGVQVPLLVTGTPTYRDNAERIASLVPGARVALLSGYPYDGALGREIRQIRERFWTEAGLSNGRPASKEGHPSLSDREVEVLRLMVDGRANKEIAEALTISQPTVATHVRHILEKTGSANRAQATAWAIRNGLG